MTLSKGGAGRRWIYPALLMVLPGLLGACRQPGGPSEAAPAEVMLEMKEYDFTEVGELPPGPITFRAENVGRENHDLTLIPIPASLKVSLDDQLRSDRRMAVVPIARIKARSPGQQGFFAVDLEPGRYGIVCFVRDASGAAHARKGMSGEFLISQAQDS